MNHHKKSLSLALLLAVLVGLGFSPVAHSAPVIETSSERYELWYNETFDKGNVAAGQWDRGPYTSRIEPYHNFKERNIGPVVFDKNTLTVHDGVLDIWGHKRFKNGAWEPVGGGIVPKLGGKYAGIQYARFEYKVGFFPQGSEGMSKWWFVGLLWPEATPGHEGGDHRRGETDWPEGVPGEGEQGFQHETGANPERNCYRVPNETGRLLTGWHDYAIDWRPTGITFYRDGEKVGFTNCGMPIGNMLFKIQLVSRNLMPSSNSHGHIFIDNIKIYKYFKS